MTDITHIPLSRLTPWEGNVRKTQSKTFIRTLAASIKAHGLQQNLVVRRQGKKFAVVAGGQRLKALNLLAEQGAIASDHPVPCKVADGEIDATELSLAENTLREDMHPADQFEAFRLLVDQGAPVEDIAARFGVTAAGVMQRLKLARVSPLILKAYRKNELTLEHVMAFAVSEDRKAQERVFSGLTPWQGAREIRAALTENDIAASDRRVQFVTLKAYEKAGGATRRDLFTDGDDGIFILDTALLDNLMVEKLERTANTLRKEGWKWVESRASFGYDDRAPFHRAHPEQAPLSPEETAALDALGREHEALMEAWEGAGEDAPRPDRLDEVKEAIDKLNDRDDVWPPETLAIAGAVVAIGHDGKACIERGLIRPEDKPKRGAKPKPPRDAEAEGTESGDAPRLSAALTESLSAERSAALSAELLARPDIALAAVVHGFASRVLLDEPFSVTSLQITASPQSLHRVEGSKAFARVEEVRAAWGQQLPRTSEALWEWCLRQDQAVLLDLLAFCAATTVDAVQERSSSDAARMAHTAQLASALSLDMRAWFAPTAANYFSRIAKDQILRALREAKGTPPAPAWEKLKKADLAALAERETAGTGWLPELLR